MRLVEACWTRIGHLSKISFGFLNSYSRSSGFQLPNLILIRVLSIKHAGRREEALECKEKSSLDERIVQESVNSREREKITERERECEMFTH